MVPRLPACLHCSDRWTIPNQVLRNAFAYKNKYRNSAYAKHLIYHGHSLGHMEDIMDVIIYHTQRKTPGYS